MIFDLYGDLSEIDLRVMPSNEVIILSFQDNDGTHESKFFENNNYDGETCWIWPWNSGGVGSFRDIELDHAEIIFKNISYVGKKDTTDRYVFGSMRHFEMAILAMPLKLYLYDRVPTAYQVDDISRMQLDMMR